MAQQELIRATPERRCPNCGTRVAVEAESCFMCGYDLRTPQRRKRSVSLIDTLLVVAVLAVLAFWWQMGGQQPSSEETAFGEAILPTNIPQLTITPSPTPTSTPPPTPPPTLQLETQIVQRIHEVQSGDTLSAIATRYQVSVEEIQAASGLRDIVIRPGQRLTIPVSIRVTAPGAGAAPAQYTVLQGDTIVSIATKLGTSIEAILAANGLAQSDIIKPGQVLQIPAVNLPSEVITQADQAPTQTDSAPAAPVKIYDTPRLLAPPNSATLNRNDGVLLQWVSVAVLAPNEWYVLQLYPAEGAAQTLPTLWTKSTSYRMSTELTPAEGASATYSWQVSVIRVTTGSNGQRLLEPVSLTSETRRFTWQ